MHIASLAVMLDQIVFSCRNPEKEKLIRAEPRMYIGLSLLIALMIPGFILGLRDVFTITLRNEGISFPLLIGFGIGTLIYYLILRRKHAFTNLEHELTHAFMALLLFRRITSFRSGSDGGYVSHSGGFGGEIGNIVIRLAPYSLPTFAFIFALIRPLTPPYVFPYYDAVTGLTLGYHTFSTIHEIKFNFHKRTFFYAGTNTPTLSDIGQTGYILSTVLIIFLTLLFHGIFFAVLTMNYSGILKFFSLSWNYSEGFLISFYFQIKKVLVM